MSHNCDSNLRAAQKKNVLLLPSYAQEGDLWQCSCGKVWVHVCDEAEGCYWVETDDHR